MRAMGRADHDRLSQPGRVLLCERQRDHAAVRRPDAAVQPIDTELVQQPDDHVALVERAH